MTPKELSSLEGVELRTAFITYFKPWALTPSCLELLKKIALKIVAIKYNENLKIYFENEDEDEVDITFGAHYQGDLKPLHLQYQRLIKRLSKCITRYYLVMACLTT